MEHSGTVWSCKACRRSTWKAIATIALAALVMCAVALTGCATINEPCYQLISMQPERVIMFDACHGNLVTLTRVTSTTTTTLPVY